MAIRFVEIHASESEDTLNQEWVVLENDGKTPFHTRGCGMTVGRRGSNKKSLLGVIDPGLGQRHGLDLVTVAVDGRVQLPPRPPLRVAMLSDLPLPLAEDLQPGAVHDEVERPLALAGQVHPQVGGPAGQRAVVGDVQVKAHQLEDRPGEPLSCPQRQVEDGSECQQALDGQAAEDELGSPLVRPGVAPGIEGLLIHPDRQRSPLD